MRYTRNGSMKSLQKFPRQFGRINLGNGNIADVTGFRVFCTD